MKENRLGSTIPSKVGLLPKLLHFSVRSNRLTGTVPTNLSDLTNLVHLDMSVNPSLSGEILDHVESWPNMEYLDINQSPFTGSLPSTMSQLERLTNLAFGPYISGSIAFFIPKLTDLKALYIEGSGISGPFPDLAKTGKVGKFQMQHGTLNIPYRGLFSHNTHV
jgi:LRR receptor-like serine/threonine-protein kinase FLS2